MPGLIGTVHARSAVSPAVDAWHTNFHRMLESMIVAQLAASGVAEPERRPAARLTMFVVEGLLTHADDTRLDRGAILDLLTAPLGRRNAAEPVS